MKLRDDRPGGRRPDGATVPPPPGHVDVRREWRELGPGRARPAATRDELVLLRTLTTHHHEGDATVRRDAADIGSRRHRAGRLAA